MERLKDSMDFIAREIKPDKSLRDEFAMAALTGSVASQSEFMGSITDMNDVARFCYQFADAMLRARER